MRPSYFPYRCLNCNTLFEIELRKLEEILIKCPQCPNWVKFPKEEVDRLLHMPTLKYRLPKNRNGSLK